MISALTVGLMAGSARGVAAMDQPAQRQNQDPDRTVCQNIRETGSRLARRRICMTAAPWAEERRQTREGMERLQIRGLQGEPN